jgi:hypothetical protein
MSIRATHAPQSSLRPHGGPPPTVRYAAGRFWPGIFTGFDAFCSCTRATKDEVYQVKLRDSACLNHGGSSAGGAP